MRTYCWLGFVFGIVVVVAIAPVDSRVWATGVLYADPGWYHALEGDSAFYYDPDGPNPDYTRTSGPDDNNQPGGQTNQPALIMPSGGCPTADCSAQAIWQNSGSQWDGSKPGDPLGGAPGSPPIPPPAPGGVGAFTNGSTTFVRIQDAGQPQNWGWADKGEQGFITGPRQEGNNRRIQFKHEMNRDPLFSDRADIIDFGVTISFRARVATVATGPLDAIFPEGGGTNPTPWPTDGVGYPVGNNGRGMFMLTQTSAAGPGQLSFSLLNSNSIAANGLTVAKTGLVMNNRASGPSGSSPDTGDSTAGTLNIVEINDTDLQNWHEFWITVKKLPSPVSNNTHEVNVYLDGSLTPQTFQVILGNQNEFGTGSHLGMGLSSGTRFGAYDVDYFAYKEGVFTPTLAGLAGDFNQNGVVDAADYAIWRDSVGTTNTLPNDDGIGGTVGTLHYNLWRAHFGQSAGAGSSVSAAAVPEPSSLFIVLAANAIATLVRSRWQVSRSVMV